MSRYFLAWLPDGLQPFSETEHAIEDDDVFSFDLSHQEGGFAELSIEYLNPRVGLLNADRDQWVWFSRENDAGDITPLFHGRIIGVPEQMDDEIIRLSFRARPADFEAQKAALADTLKVHPYYDPIWIDPEKLDDPDTVLEGRTALWHIGRTDKTVTISDVAVGEAGTLTFDEDDILEESVDCTFSEEPISKVRMTAEVQWEETGFGELDLTTELVRLFRNEGSAEVPSDGNFPFGQIASFTGEGLEATWPLPGAQIGGGWSVGQSSVQLLSGTAVRASFVTTPILPVADEVERTEDMTDLEYERALAEAAARAAADPIRSARFYLWVFAPIFTVNWEAQRTRKEILTFEVDADVQAMLADAAPRVVDINMSSSSVVLDIDEGSSSGGGDGKPIGDIRRKTFFNLDRGKLALETLMAFARARIIMAARAVDVSFEVPLDLALDISCRHDCIVHCGDLPGGQAGGKVISYKLSMDDGEEKAEITIGCSVGRGNALPALDAGDPVYVSSGYVQSGYQHYEGMSVMPIPGSIFYTDYNIPIVDDGWDLFNVNADDAILNFTVTNRETDQRDVLSETYARVDDAIAALNAAHTFVELELKTMRGGPFENLFPITVSDLMVTKTIDLEAELAT